MQAPVCASASYVLRCVSLHFLFCGICFLAFFAFPISHLLPIYSNVNFHKLHNVGFYSANAFNVTSEKLSPQT